MIFLMAMGTPPLFVATIYKTRLGRWVSFCIAGGAVILPEK